MTFLLTSPQAHVTRTLLLGVRMISSKPVKNTKVTQIYKSPMGNLVVGAKIFSLTSSSLVLAAQPFIVTASPAAATPFIVASMIFAFLTPALLHQLTGPTVFSIDCIEEREVKGEENKDEDVMAGQQLIAYTKSIFLRKRRVPFTVGDIEYAPGSLSLANLTVNGGRTPLLILESGFTSLEWRTLIFGFDKPIKWD